jgi:hypothetical protein
MATTSAQLSVAVIGDVIASRDYTDRVGLQTRMESAFGDVDSVVPAQQAFAMTIGDEFQGIFAGLDQAVVATFILQVTLVDRVRVRFGIGVGEVIHLGDQAPYQQDGSAWWRAREAIDLIRRGERSRGTPLHQATGLVAPEHPQAEATRRYLVLRDHMVGGLDRTDADIVLGLMNGDTQTEIADRIGIDKGAVSRRVARHGLSALLSTLPEWT